MRLITNAAPFGLLTTGIGRYVRCLYGAIAETGAHDVAFCSPSGVTRRMPRPMGRRQWSQMTALAWKLPAVAVFAARTLSRMHYEQRLRRACRQGSFDVYHETGYVPAAMRSVPTVYTLHDLSLLRLPETHPRERVMYFRHFLKRRLSYADHILTVSEFVRSEIVRDLGVARERVTAIPNAPGPQFAPQDPQSVRRLLRARGWPSDYFLFVGSLEPRKNLVALIRALGACRAKAGLILVGWRAWGDRRFVEEIERLGLGSRVHLAGYLDDATLAVLYSGALALVFPSLYEGFGLPVVEAMACGCPVICSDTSGVREAAGEAAVRVAPCDVRGWAAAMDAVDRDPDMRCFLVERGRARAGNFSWQRSARMTLELFRQVGETRGG